ncbi:MAG: bifunctional lysylphosphatidylglycerol flippase/synthetase MprF, partial [Acidimicrobiales bacterium]
VVADRVRTRRVRRVAAGAIFLAGLVDLVAAVSRPAAGHLVLVRQILPLAVAQAAGALVALAGIALVMLARGVLRGQRRAWLVASALLAATLVLHLVHGGGLGVLLLTAVVLGLLVAERDLFGAAADHASTRSAAATLAVGGTVAVLAAWAGAEVSGRWHHATLPAWPMVLLAVTERLAGLHSVPLPDPVQDWISPSMLGVGIALALVSLYLLTRPVVDRTLSSEEAGARGPSLPVAPAGTAGLAQAMDLQAAQAQAQEPARPAPGRRAAELRARDIVRRHGTGTLDYFALRDDKRWFFHHDTLVAYAVYGGVCVVSPDPIGPHGERRQAWHAFRRHCDRRGWGVAVMAAAGEWLPLYHEDGMRHVYLGDEAVVDLERFSLQGGRMKGLRQAVTRMGRYGYTVRFLDPAAVTPETAAPLVELTGRNRRGDHERGFSMMLGRIFDRRDTGLLLTVVDGPDGAPAAMCQFVPSAAIGGYSLDLMRRDPGEHPNGLLDFALCSTIEHLRREGKRGLSLNFAAMRSTLEGGSGDGVTQRVERWALRRMSGVFQIESLWRFNAKYEPAWVPRSIVYDAPELIPPTVVAILRAEALTDVPVIGRFLVPAAARR